jgi:hypothetical protein
MIEIDKDIFIDPTKINTIEISEGYFGIPIYDPITDIAHKNKNFRVSIVIKGFNYKSKIFDHKEDAITLMNDILTENHWNKKGVKS